ncbi:P-loop containing nucleoside triphosphate hydrolase [Synechococcus sp. PROS-7-1]|uniref:sulfotransferase family protein n=1 Tax=Synechococcus sp. PROS-7-1 TaxID=1442556 RepID=UPI0016489315|nr:sulfotransferase [Synechococcus sp. PROS-7-1]QNI83917.1 P-loop containing nucleoside triphosphate hydrolase [Synechococcus sp. PROS-7-1]
MRLFFIVGAQKSGTTWLQRSLNSVAGVHCLGEGHFIDKLMLPFTATLREYNTLMELVAERVYEGQGYYDPIKDVEFRSVMRGWILQRMVNSTKVDHTTITAIGDKTPAHSFHIDSLRFLFPEARFIHMLRDGRDVTVSAFHHKERVLRKLGQNDPNADLNQEAAALLHKWAEFTRAVLKADANGHPIHTVRYEAMLADPTATLLACLQHIVPDHSWDQAMVQTAVDANSFRQKSGRDPGQASSTSFLRKGTAGSWREELDPAALSRFAPEDQTLLNQLGYSD